MADVRAEFAVPTSLIPRCVRVHGWNDEACTHVLKAYRQFMELKVHHEDWDAIILSPPRLVDQMWHQHILNVQHYVKSCTAYCGNLIGHNPDGALDVAARAERVKTTQISVTARFGKGNVNAEIWSFGTTTPQSDSNNKRARSDSDASSNKEDRITIRIRDHITGDETFWKIKPSSKMSTVFDPYAQAIGIQNAGLLRFLLDGERIEEDQTPQFLEIHNQDQIDVLREQGAC